MLLGGLVGFPLGLTGAGGAILAVPALVYGLGVPPHEAVGISLLTVGATAWVGAIGRIRSREADLRSGLLVALSGAVATPLGAWVNALIPERTLLGAFGLLMLVLGLQLFRTAPPLAGPRRDSHPRTRDLRLAAIGLGVGLLSGLFGIGGGFLVVPSLILVARLPIHTAAATSLVVIALISSSGWPRSSSRTATSTSASPSSSWPAASPDSRSAPEPPGASPGPDCGGRSRPSSSRSPSSFSAPPFSDDSGPDPDEAEAARTRVTVPGGLVPGGLRLARPPASAGPRRRRRIPRRDRRGGAAGE